jgi:hypothetical protein
MQRWCENGGYIEGAEAIELDISEPTEEVVGAFARFLIWYANGRKGDPNKQRKGGNKVCVCVCVCVCVNSWSVCVPTLL